MSVKPGHQFTQDSTSFLVYQFDWSDWLGDDAEVDTYDIDIDGPDEALDYDNDALAAGDSSGRANTAVELRISGGTVGKTYKVSCRITTDESPTQTDPRHFTVRIL